MHQTIRGVLAAVLTPRLKGGTVDDEALSKNIESLLDQGVDGVVLNGATGEYPRTTASDFERILKAAAHAASGARFIVGIGAPDLITTLKFGEQALSAGAKAVLLPAPAFFDYAEEDVSEYCASVADTLQSKILLYNLTQFTAGFQLPTVKELFDRCPAIVGIKDSSGSLDILRSLTQHQGPKKTRIVGNDSVLVQALSEGSCDAVISGVAGVLPELILVLGREKAGDAERYREAALLLDDLLAQLNACPVPWGLLWIAEQRGLRSMNTAYPLSAARVEQRNAFRVWFDGWLERAKPVLEMAEALG